MLLAFSACVAGSPIFAQQSTPQSDTLRLADVWRTVLANHPVVRQARSVLDQAVADSRTARGAYDPSVSASWEQKNYGGSLYYDYLKGTATIPTPFGPDLKLSYENTAGRYINPERRTSAPGLLSIGLSLPIGQRWLADERRVSLTIAREAERIAAQDVRSAENRVILESTRDYARWYEAHRRVGIGREGLAMAEARYEFTRSRVRGGEAAPLDTVEALLEVQRRKSSLVEAEQSLFNARAAMALHLWDSTGRPVALNAFSVPVFDRPNLSTDDDAIISQSVGRHPDVIKARSRFGQTRAQQQLANAQRVPLPSLELFALSAADEFPLSNSVNYGANGNNLKRGAGLTVPLFFLKERGRAASASARYQQTLIDQSRVELAVRTNISIAMREMATAAQLLDLQRDVISNAQLIVRGEDTRFRNGESTLLLVMIRERALLDELLRVATLEQRLMGSYADRVTLTGEWEALVRSGPR